MALLVFKFWWGDSPWSGEGKGDFTTQAWRVWSPWRTRGRGVVSFPFYLYPIEDLTTLDWVLVVVVLFCFRELGDKVPFLQSHWASSADYLQEKQLAQRIL